MSFHEAAIPIISIIVPVCVLFAVRVLDKGEKKRERLHIDLEELEKRVRTVELEVSRIWGRLNGKSSS